MKTKHRDDSGNLFYICYHCKSEFNFKAMKRITEKESCPTCDKKIKL